MSENKVLFVNVSDLHLKADDPNEIIAMLESLRGYIESIKLKDGCEKSLIIISGDIVYSGSKDQYDTIFPLFKLLSENSDLVFCPGNHDHDFSSYSSNSSRDMILNSNIKDDINDELVDICISGQKAYYEFSSKLTFSSPSKENSLCKVYDYDQFKLYSLNTAWCSKIKEKGGDLFFPEKFLIDPDESTINILFFHHPLGWFRPVDNKTIRNYARKGFGITITGHEHVADSHNLVTQDKTVLMIESPSFYDPNVFNNGFVSFIIEDEDVIVKEHIWNENKCDFEQTRELNKSKINSSNKKTINGVGLDLNFYNKINDIGAGFSHIDKGDLDLTDVFVYPNIRIDSDGANINKRSSEDLLSNDKFSKIIITGEEFCGKSALVKKMYLDAIEEGCLCVLLYGLNLRKSKKLIFNTVEKAVNNQYSNLSYQEFLQSGRKKILFIDDYDSIEGPIKDLVEKSSLLFKQFDRVVVTVSDSYDIGNSRLQSDNLFDDFEKVEILKFGYRLRYELINKWNLMHEKCQISKIELTAKNDLSKKTIDDILGKNYIPSSPFFLLTMLQSIDNRAASEINTSSYGYYYQYLITSSFGQSGILKEELDEMFSYVKELSFYYYNRNTKSENYNELWDFHIGFCKSYGLKFDLEKRLGKLVKAKILSYNEVDGLYSFKYPYVYYFFIAKYLSDSLSEEESQTLIEKLIDELDKSKSMSILMFLTHHSKDKSILDKIVAKAKSVFEFVDKANLDLDSMFIDNIINKLPPVTYVPKYKDSHEYRLKVEEQKDYIDYSENDEVIDSEGSDSDPRAIEFIKEINLAFKSLELLGQLARNYYGSLKLEEKRRLMNEAIATPLRGIGALFKIITEDPDETIELIKHSIEQKLEASLDVNDRDIDNFAREALFGLLATISFSSINKIANSIGNAKLMPVIEELSSDNPTNSYKLIHLATRLDEGSSVNPDKIKRIIDEVDQNAISTTIVQGMIINYLYMYEVNDSVVKKLCNAGQIHYPNLSKKLLLEK